MLYLTTVKNSIIKEPDMIGVEALFLIRFHFTSDLILIICRLRSMCGQAPV